MKSHDVLLCSTQDLQPLTVSLVDDPGSPEADDPPSYVCSAGH